MGQCPQRESIGGGSLLSGRAPAPSRSAVREDHSAVRGRRHQAAAVLERVRRFKGGSRALRLDACRGGKGRGHRRERRGAGRAKYTPPQRRGRRGGWTGVTDSLAL